MQTNRRRTTRCHHSPLSLHYRNSFNKQTYRGTPYRQTDCATLQYWHYSIDTTVIVHNRNSFNKHTTVLTLQLLYTTETRHYSIDTIFILRYTTVLTLQYWHYSYCTLQKLLQQTDLQRNSLQTDRQTPDRRHLNHFRFRSLQPHPHKQEPKKLRNSYEIIVMLFTWGYIQQ